VARSSVVPACEDRAVDVRAAVEQVWPGRRASWEVLGSGLTRHNVKVTLDDEETFVLRLVGPETEALGIDRGVEREACLAAAAVGVGPRVEAFVEPSGPLVTRWLPGHPLTPEDVRSEEALRRVAAALRVVHRGPPLPRRYHAFEVVEDLRSTAFAHGAELPPEYVRARQLARRIAQARGPTPERPCHNDLVCANLIDDGTRIRIVDWEVAGMGDVFFDLASVAVDAELDADARRLLLEAYGRFVRPQDERALELMRFMVVYRDALWGVVQGAVAEVAFDVAGYVAERFAQLEAIAVDPAFTAALARG
jgi:thiamine kinase-like enzyme